MKRLDSTYQIWKTQAIIKSINKDEQLKQLKEGVTKGISQNISNTVYATFRDNSVIAKNQTIIESARLMDVNPSTIHLLCKSDDNGTYQNTYDYQQISLKTAATATQNNIINLATQQTLSLTRGLTYKVFYRQIGEGNVLTESAFYNYAVAHANAKPDVVKNNSLIYDRNMSDIDGIVDSLKLIK